MKPSVSVIILTYNEESNLPAALDSVKGWASEVFVVDSLSTDRTVDVALERAADGVRVVQRKLKNHPDQWNWALTHLPITGDWTLKLDADERVTPEFKKELEEVLCSAPPDLDGVQFRRLFFFMGKPLRFAFPMVHDLRLWRTGTAVFDLRPTSEHAHVRGRIGTLKSYVDHYDFKSLTDWINKHNRYSSQEAISIIQGDLTGGVKPRLFGTPTERKAWQRKWYFRVPGRPLLYFLYRCFLRLGFLDGLIGFRFILLHTCFMYWIDLKRGEYQATGKMPAVYWEPRGEPHPILANSELQRQVNAGAPARHEAGTSLSPHPSSVSSNN